MYFGSTQQAAGTYGSSSSLATFTDDTRFAGTGMLTVTTGAVSNDYDTWLGGFTFAAGTDTTPIGDPDGDGQSNRQEDAFGLNPTSGASVSPITVPLDKTSGSFTYTRRNPSLSNLNFKVWTCYFRSAARRHQAAISPRKIPTTNPQTWPATSVRGSEPTPIHDRSTSPPPSGTK